MGTLVDKNAAWRGTMRKRSSLKNCWEIKKCERHGNGKLVGELGECAASLQGMGHTCWAVKGTVCGGVVQGSAEEKEPDCRECRVYKMYHRGLGNLVRFIKKLYPDEEKRYQQLLMQRIAERLK